MHHKSIIYNKPTAPHTTQQLINT